MAAATEPRQVPGEALPSRRQELFMFVLLAILIWPVIAVAVVGGYGFAVWMWQLIFGPPGPPAP
jgi:periplasmic nitrate reductase NapE